MAHKVFDLAQQLTTGTGTGALTLGAVPAGCIGFADQGAIAGDTFWGCIRHLTANEVEVTLCTIVGDGTITRAATPLISTTGSKINFSAGTKTITCVAPGLKSVVMDPNGDAAVTRYFAANKLIGEKVNADAPVQPSFNLVSRDTGKWKSHVGFWNSGDLKWQLGVDINDAGQRNLFIYDAVGGETRAYWDQYGQTLVGMMTVNGVGYFQSSVYFGDGALAATSRNGGTDTGLVRAGVQFDGANQALNFYTANTWRGGVDASGNYQPGSDNTKSMGLPSWRWSVVYAGTGSINTSGQADKLDVVEASAAEREWARLIRGRGPKRYKFKDAVDAKGDAARWHFGYVVEDILADAETAGIVDPWRYAFLCRDRKIVREAYTETEMREKRRTVTVEETAIEIRDGVPVQLRKSVEREERVGAMVALQDEQGNPVVREVRDEKGNVTGTAPLMHFVPEMEEVEVERFREVETDEWQYGLRYSELEAFLACAA